MNSSRIAFSLLFLTTIFSDGETTFSLGGAEVGQTKHWSLSSAQVDVSAYRVLDDGSVKSDPLPLVEDLIFTKLYGPGNINAMETVDNRVEFWDWDRNQGVGDRYAWAGIHLNAADRSVGLQGSLLVKIPEEEQRVYGRTAAIASYCDYVIQDHLSVSFDNPLWEIAPDQPLYTVLYWETHAENYAEHRSSHTRSLAHYQASYKITRNSYLKRAIIDLETGEDSEDDEPLMQQREVIDEGSQNGDFRGPGRSTQTVTIASEPFAVLPNYSFEIRTMFYLEGELFGAGSAFADLTNTFQLKAVRFFDSNMQPVSGGSMRLGRNGKVLATPEGPGLYQAKEISAEYLGNLRGDLRVAQGELEAGAVASVSLPDGASIQQANLYILGQAEDDYPEAPEVRFGESVYEGDRFKVAAISPEGQTAFRVHATSEFYRALLEREDSQGPLTFSISATASEDFLPQAYYLVVVYAHPNAQQRSIAIVDGFSSQAFEFTYDEGLVLTDDKADLILGDWSADDSSILQIDGRRVEISSDLDLATGEEPLLTDGQTFSTIAMERPPNAFPFVLALNIATPTPIAFKNLEAAKAPNPYELEPGHLEMRMIRMNAQGKAELEVRSEIGASVEVQTSEDLRHWDSGVTFYNDEGVTTVVDEEPGGRRFYRAMVFDDNEDFEESASIGF